MTESAGYDRVDICDYCGHRTDGASEWGTRGRHWFSRYHGHADAMTIDFCDNCIRLLPKCHADVKNHYREFN